MDPASIPGLESIISAPRFARYLSRYNGNRTVAARMYAWNLSVSAAFWEPICVLEVAVRNAIHDQLVEGRKRPDWWNDTTLNLCRNERDSVNAAIATLVARGNTSPTSDQVVAATSFRLWVGLTGEGLVGNHLFRYETTLWQPRLIKAFPNAGQRRRKYIHAELDKIRVLRNRIAHHEPIYNAPLPALHDAIIEIAAMVHPDAGTFIAHSSRVPAVLANQQSALTTGTITI